MLGANTIQNSSPELREFLELSCLYLAAADQQFTGAEQEWIDASFGHGTADRFAANFATIQWENIFLRIDELAKLIPALEMQIISGGIEVFLKQLLSVDGWDSVEEERLIEYIEHLAVIGINTSQATPQEEVDEFKARLNFLLSIHKSQGRAWNWAQIAASLPPAYPNRFSTNRLQALQNQSVFTAASIYVAQDLVTTAEESDESAFQKAYQRYCHWHGEFQKTQQVAYRVMRGETEAYGEVLQRLGPFTSIEELGSTVEFAFHSPKIAECNIAIHGADVIPSQEKRLTKKGKLSVKKMPRARFHEIYQDYVCGCILRIGREMFALLPLEHVLVTAKAEVGDPPAEHSVMSVIFPSSIMDEVDFESTDPSDCVESYMHRGDFKATRKDEAFRAIIPLTIADVPEAKPDQLSFEQLSKEVERMHKEVHERRGQWGAIS